jgi:hypothetical protein
MSDSVEFISCVVQHDDIRRGAGSCACAIARRTAGSTAAEGRQQRMDLRERAHRLGQSTADERRANDTNMFVSCRRSPEFFRITTMPSSSTMLMLAKLSFGIFVWNVRISSIISTRFELISRFFSIGPIRNRNTSMFSLK